MHIQLDDHQRNHHGWCRNERDHLHSRGGGNPQAHLHCHQCCGDSFQHRSEDGRRGCGPRDTSHNRSHTSHHGGCGTEGLSASPVGMHLCLDDHRRSHHRRERYALDHIHRRTGGDSELKLYRYKCCWNEFHARHRQRHRRRRPSYSRYHGSCQRHGGCDGAGGHGPGTVWMHVHLGDHRRNHHGRCRNKPNRLHSSGGGNPQAYMHCHQCCGDSFQHQC